MCIYIVVVLGKKTATEGQQALLDYVPDRAWGAQDATAEQKKLLQMVTDKQLEYSMYWASSSPCLSR